MAVARSVGLRVLKLVIFSPIWLALLYALMIAISFQQKVNL
jgi:hypothetical protein